MPAHFDVKAPFHRLPSARRGLPTHAARARVDGKFLSIGDERFWIRAVTYGSFAPNGDGEQFPPIHQVRDDFARMRDANVNTVRIYTPPSDRIADLAADLRLHLFADLCWGPRSSELEDPATVRAIVAHTREHARRLARHPAMLLYGIGNEIPPLVARWYGRAPIERFLRSLHDTIKAEDPEALVTYANHPPTEYLDLSFLDVLACNVYLHDERHFRRYLSRLQTLAGMQPLLLSELGLDSAHHGLRAQAEHLRQQILTAFAKGLCGVAVYAWTDEWAIFDTQLQDWAFGVTDRERRAKPALLAMRRAFGRTMLPVSERSWPRVSVVVATYNGAATLDACLRSLGALRYPDYEVIVVDDGSEDDTPSIVARHAVRSLRIPHGGLSRARNAGIEAATGSVVAFLDSDARADRDWLCFLVQAIEEQKADAVGGPNVAPPEDPFVAQCVDHAPGNPTHVLIDDAQAEHVAGCNMAWRRDALHAIGMFDVQHHAAGDDVDVCWKLLQLGGRIAFAPCAVVYHHRRGTVRGFLRQQQGYGRAEVVLRRRHPARFNVLGGLVWHGSIYNGHGGILQRRGAPRAGARVHHGTYCGAMFQAVYPAFQPMWVQAFTLAGWQMLTLSVLLSGVLGLIAAPGSGVVLLGIGLGMLAATVTAALAVSLAAVRARGWRGTRRWLGALLIAALQVLQPLARSYGRLRARREAPGRAEPRDRRLWGNVHQRHVWLDRLGAELRGLGWACRPGNAWERDDLLVLGPGPYTVALRSTCEEDLQSAHHWIRFVVRARPKWWLPLLWLLLLGGAVACALQPFLLPLLAPLVWGMAALWNARDCMERAMIHVAVDCAEVMGMPRVAGST